MRIRLKKLIIVCLLFIFSNNFSYSQSTPLLGNYSINNTKITSFPTGKNFNTFTDAIKALDANGVSGSVTFIVSPGIYTEQITIKTIKGSSPNDTITFIGDQTQTPELQYAPDIDNWIIKFDGASNVRIVNLAINNLSTTNQTIGRVLFFDNSKSTIKNIKIVKNILRGRITTNNLPDLAVIGIEQSLSQPATSFLTISDNKILNGSYGIYLKGENEINQGIDNLIIRNIISDFYITGIFADYQNKIQVTDNSINPNTITDTQSGIEIISVTNNSELINNRINLQATINNTGIYITKCRTTASVSVLVANNFISVKNGTNPGIGLKTESNQKLVILHNSINIFGSNNNSVALKILPGIDENIILENNILANNATGKAIQIELPEKNILKLSNYNCLYSNGNTLGNSADSIATNLSDWKRITKADSNSISLKPSFFSDTDLYLQNYAGFKLYNSIGLIKTDIDKQNRSVIAPVIGADETGFCGTISTNTTWSGLISVFCDINILSGATLTITPGSIIEFCGGYKIDVQGTLLAQGLYNQLIKFLPSNKAEGWRGIQYYYPHGTNDTSRFEYCIFDSAKDTIGDGFGGAMNIEGYEKVILKNCTFKNNKANTGGAMRLVSYSTPITSCSFTNNYANSSGGAVWVDGNSVFIFCLFDNNKARQNGGALILNYSPLISNCIFKNDSAQQGGALILGWNSNATIKNSIFHNNKASTYGGAIYAGNASGVLENNTIIYNNASSGSGISFYYDCINFSIRNNIIYKNKPDQIFIGLPNYSDPNFYFNNIENGKAGFTGNGAGTNFTGAYSNNLETDPLFIDVVNNDFHLQNISPCINAGDPLFVPNFPFDLDKKIRISQCRIDLGCYESFSIPAVTGYVYWLGCADDNWDNPKNWSHQQIPTNLDNVYIPGVNFANFQPVITGIALCKTITIEADQGAFITIKDNGVLSTN